MNTGDANPEDAQNGQCQSDAVEAAESSHLVDGVSACIFVTGIMRSGTSLLQRVIARSCAAEYIREESSLHVLVESFHVLDQYQAYHLLERTEYVQHYQRFIAGILAASKSKVAHGPLVLKDPFALKTLAWFHELMPTTKFVISIRNPLAIAASIYRVRNRQRQQGKRSFLTPMDFGDIVEYIERLCDVIIGMRESKNICLVQYEGLIGRVPAVLAGLSHFLGVKVSLDLDDDSAAYNPDHAFWTPESGTTIKLSSLDKYKTELTPEERALAAVKFARFNAMFGYVDV